MWCGSHTPSERSQAGNLFIRVQSSKKKYSPGGLPLRSSLLNQRSLFSTLFNHSLRVSANPLFSRRLRCLIRAPYAVAFLLSHLHPLHEERPLTELAFSDARVADLEQLIVIHDIADIDVGLQVAALSLPYLGVGRDRHSLLLGFSSIYWVVASIPIDSRVSILMEKHNVLPR